MLITSSDPTSPRLTRLSSQTAASTTISTLVALPPPGLSAAPKAVRGARVVARPDEKHFGQWKPTDAGFMHSPQIGRWQRWQEIPVIRSGCR